MDYILFSETHSRFIISTKYSSKIKDYLTKEKISFAEIGNFTIEKNCIIKKNSKVIFNLFLNDLKKKYEEFTFKYFGKKQQRDLNYHYYPYLKFIYLIKN